MGGKPAHTPGPWRVAENATGNNKGKVIRSVHHDEGGAIAISLGYQSEECLANAARIVHCVNHHDELVDSLRHLSDVFERFLGDIGHSSDSYQRDEIAKARALLKGGV